MVMHMTKVPEYPRPHEDDTSWAMPLETASLVQDTTIFPVLYYDEGLGIINSYKSNPQNAGFAEYGQANCYPSSEINTIYCEGTFSMSKELLETDKCHAIKFATMKIHTSFMDGQLAEDEVSGLDLNEILELTNESTDRQTHPLFNGTDMRVYKGGGLNLGAAQLGLTTDVKIEGVAFNTDDYYDCLHYYTNGKKLKAIQDGLVWHTLTRQHPVKTIRFTQDEQTKYMNPYSGLFILIHLPQNSGHLQYGKVGDTTTDTNALEVIMKFRYNEWNHEFDHGLQ